MTVKNTITSFIDNPLLWFTTEVYKNIYVTSVRTRHLLHVPPRTQHNPPVEQGRLVPVPDDTGTVSGTTDAFIPCDYTDQVGCKHLDEGLVF